MQWRTLIESEHTIRILRTQLTQKRPECHEPIVVVVVVIAICIGLAIGLVSVAVAPTHLALSLALSPPHMNGCEPIVQLCGHMHGRVLIRRHVRIHSLVRSRALRVLVLIPLFMLTAWWQSPPRRHR